MIAAPCCPKASGGKAVLFYLLEKFPAVFDEVVDGLDLDEPDFELVDGREDELMEALKSELQRKLRELTQ